MFALEMWWYLYASVNARRSEEKICVPAPTSTVKLNCVASRLRMVSVKYRNPPLLARKGCTRLVVSRLSWMPIGLRPAPYVYRLPPVSGSPTNASGTTLARYRKAIPSSAKKARPYRTSASQRLVSCKAEGVTIRERAAGPDPNLIPQCLLGRYHSRHQHHG